MSKLQELKQEIVKLETFEDIKNALFSGKLTAYFSEVSRDRAYDSSKTFYIRFSRRDVQGFTKDITKDIHLTQEHLTLLDSFIKNLLEIKEE